MSWLSVGLCVVIDCISMRLDVGYVFGLCYVCIVMYLMVYGLMLGRLSYVLCSVVRLVCV